MTLVDHAPDAVDAERRPRRRRLGEGDLTASGLVRHGHARGSGPKVAFRRHQRGPGLVDFHLEITRVQAHERGPRRHLLVVAREHLHHGAAHP